MMDAKKSACAHYDAFACRVCGVPKHFSQCVFSLLYSLLSLPLLLLLYLPSYSLSVTLSVTLHSFPLSLLHPPSLLTYPPPPSLPPPSIHLSSLLSPPQPY